MKVSLNENNAIHRDAATTRNFDAVVVGAGFAGMYMLYKLRALGFSAVVFERGSDVGGTWYWNRYPGARCDAPSMQYSYQFSEDLQQEWTWSETFASQAEILRYLNHVADRFDLRRDIQFNTSIQRVIFDDSNDRWMVYTDTDQRISTTFCVMATGCLSTRNTPDFKGLEDFEGEWYHTGNWPHDGVDFAGQRVGVIGTGSTGIQAIPVIAKEAAHLKVFQRSAQYSTPARNTAMDKDYEARIKSDYQGYRARNYRLPLAMDIHLDANAPKTFDVGEDERRRKYERCWERGGMGLLLAYRDSSVSSEANETISAFIRGKIAEVVDDPDVARLLMPKHIYACKRPCLDTNYFETYNRSNVSLIDVSKTGVEAITHTGLRANGEDHKLDCIVFATGFDAMTGALNRIDIRGRNGIELQDKWAGGPRSYLGLSSSGFPNLFTVSGPGSPSVLTNMVATIEQHVNWIGDCLDYMRNLGFDTIEATLEAEDPWLIRVQEVAARTLWNACDNWYQGTNIPGKPRVFMPYADWPSYLAKCEAVVANDYEGFSLR